MKHFLTVLYILSLLHCHSQTLKSARFAKDDSVEVKIFLDGNIRGIATGETEASSINNASGLVGIEVSSNKSVINLAVNIASSVDSIDANFGSVVLNPYSGRSFQSGVLDVRLKNIPLHTYFSVSNLFFKNDSIKETASILYYGFLFYKSIFSGNIGKNRIEALWELGGSLRYISGNAANNAQFYEGTFGTSKNFFPGIEGGILISFNDMTAGVQVYYLLDGDSGGNINNITGLQVTGGISFRGAFFNGKAKKNQ